MISIIMLNWRRREQVRFNAIRYSAYSRVSEIIIFTNAGPTLNFDECARPPVQISTNFDLGLYSRFAAASLARNNCILHLDDDLTVPETTVNQLHDYWCADPGICHALHGRDVSKGYRLKLAHGRVEVVLTRCLMASRALCIEALNHVHHFDDLVAEPYGNGEDIILSFTAMKQSGRMNQAYNLPYGKPPDGHGGANGQPTVAIWKRWRGHEAHRRRMLTRCREYFNIAAGNSFKKLAS